MIEEQNFTRTSEQDGAGQVTMGNKPLSPASAAALQNCPETAGGTQKTKTFLEKNSLRLAGILDFIADLGFIGNGIATKDPFKIGGGALYTLGAINAAYYGRVDKKFAIHDMSERTAEFIKEAAGKLPEDAKLSSILEQKDAGISANFNRMLHRHPGQNTMALYSAGSGVLALAGWNKYKRGEGVEELAYGLNGLAFKLGSLFITETPKGEKRKPGLLGWIQEKPLRLFGYGSLISDSLLILSARREYKNHPNQKGYMFTALSCASYVPSSILFAVSHKDPSNAGGKFTQSERDAIENLAADAIAKEPENIREQMTDQVAGFLASQKEIQENARDIRKDIQERVAEMADKSWAERTENSEEHFVQR